MAIVRPRSGFRDWLESLDVYTRDEKRLGSIREARDDSFCVAGRFGRRFWVARDDISCVERDRVWLDFSAGELDGHKLPAAA